jgi:Tfp pilus assembly protein PilN
MRAVNLLPQDETRSRQQAPLPALVGAPIAVLVAVALCGAYMQASSKLSDKTQMVADLKAQDAAIPKPGVKSAVDQTLVAQRGPRITALGQALSHSVAWDRMMREISQVLPTDVWLGNLTLTAPNSAAATTPAVPPTPGAVATGLQMTGSTYSQEAVARLLARLQIVPDLTNVQLQQSAEATVGTQKVVTFTVLADIKASGVTS